jgi:hypothetical protein
VRQADQLVPVANLDDRARRIELHHAYRAQTRDFHALELIEKAPMIGVGAALAHDASLADARQNADHFGQAWR